MHSSADRAGHGAVLRGGAAEAGAIPFQITQSQATDTAAPIDARTTARAEGYATGWAQGMRAARDATSAAHDRSVDELDRMLRERDERAASAVLALGRAVDGVRAAAETRAVELADYVLAAAVDIAQALLRAELAADTVAGARAAVRRALAEVPADEPVTIRLNPEDHVELSGTGVEDAAVGRTVILVADPTLTRGDAIAVTGVRTVDATLSAAVDRVRAELAP